MARDATKEPSPASTSAESESAVSDDSIETTVSMQLNLFMQLDSPLQSNPWMEKFNRRESWYDMDIDEKSKDTLKNLGTIDKENDSIQWVRHDSTRASKIMAFLWSFYKTHELEMKQMKDDVQASGRDAMEASQETKKLKKSKKELQLIVREQEQHIKKLKTQLLTSPAPSSTSSTTTKLKLPDISVWNGGTSQAFQSWLSDLRMKLSVNADRFSTDQHKISYLFNRIGGEAREYMESFLNEDEQDSYEYLLQQLERRYADPQRAATARNEYNTLKQMNKDLVSFLGEFYRLAAAAKVFEEWQISDLREKLNDRFYNRIVGQSFDSFPDMVHTPEQIDSHHRLRDQDKTSRPAAQKSILSRQITSTGNDREKSATGTSVATKTESAGNNGRRPAPKCFNCQEMGHIAKYCTKGTTKTESAEDTGRRPHSKCFNCQGMGHIARYCTKGKESQSSKS